MQCQNCSALWRDGNFCSNCGHKLQSESKLLQRIQRLRRAMLYYLECEGKKMAGSTIQYDSKILINALQRDEEEDE